MSFRILIQTGKAVSLTEVARQIGFVAENLGYTVVLNRGYSAIDSYKKQFKYVIFIYPVIPAWCLFWFYQYDKAKKELNNGAIFYTVVEGTPAKYAIPDWVFRNLEFVACSNYVKSRLEKIGLKVIDVVHHGYLATEIEDAVALSSRLRRVIEQKFPDKVIFGYVGDIGFRKGIDKMLTAVNKLAQKRKDFQVLFITKKEILNKIENIPCTTYVAEMGFKSHVEIMAFYGAIDYLLLPTLSEGFGLPLLEANAMGTPAVINDLPVFHEYADMKNNFVLTAVNYEQKDVGEGVLFDIYNYDENELVTLMEEAIETKKKYPSKYEDMSVKVKEAVEKFKSEELYTKLIMMLEKRAK